MNNLSIEATQNTPVIEFDFKNGLLVITGRSIPENSVGFYEPLYKAMDSYVINPNQNTSINIKLEYYNSSSCACLLNLLKRLEKINNIKSKVSVNWIYEENDEDILSAGKNFQSMVDLPFIMVPITEE